MVRNRINNRNNSDHLNNFVNSGNDVNYTYNPSKRRCYLCGELVDLTKFFIHVSKCVIEHEVKEQTYMSWDQKINYYKEYAAKYNTTFDNIVPLKKRRLDTSTSYLSMLDSELEDHSTTFATFQTGSSNTREVSNSERILEGAQTGTSDPTTTNNLVHTSIDHSVNVSSINQQIDETSQHSPRSMRGIDEEENNTESNLEETDVIQRNKRALSQSSFYDSQDSEQNLDNNGYTGEAESQAQRADSQINEDTPKQPTSQILMSCLFSCGKSLNTKHSISICIGNAVFYLCSCFHHKATLRNRTFDKSLMSALEASTNSTQRDCQMKGANMNNMCRKKMKKYIVIKNKKYPNTSNKFYACSVDCLCDFIISLSKKEYERIVMRDL